MSKEKEVVLKNTKNDYLKILLENVVVEEGFNVREDLSGIDELAKSIAKNGQVSPGIGYKIRGSEQYVLTVGHRRFEAIKLANKKYGANITHMNFMSGSSDEKERVTAMLLDGDASHSLTKNEMLKGITRLLDLGVSKKEIIDSLAIQVSQAQKYNLVAAAGAPKAVLKMIEDGLISQAKVNEFQRQTEDDVELIDLANDFVENKKTKTKGEKRVSSDVAKLEEALALSDPTTAKSAWLKAIVGRLKSKASAEDIAKLLK